MNDLRILAIDDNRDNLTALRAVLLDALPGARLLTALNGPDGIEAAKAEDPDVILLDIVMPGMDGYAVCRQLKEDARLQTIPVLFLTANNTDRDSRVRALDAGAEGFLSKPFDEVELVAQIRAMAKVRAANRLERVEKEHLAALVAERTRELEQELAERKQADQALWESEANLQKAQAVANVGSWVWRIQSNQLEWSDQMYRIFGMTKDTFTGDLADVVARAIHPDDRPAVERSNLSVINAGKPIPLEYRVIWPDGTVRVVWAEAGELILDAAGNPVVLSGIVQDITERKQGAQTQALMVAMLDATPGFVGFADAKDTHILYINPAGRKMVGVQAREDVTQLRIADVHPEWTNTLFRDEIVPTAIRDGMWTGECAFLNRDGREIPVMMALLAHKSPSGEVERFSTISIDITERNRAVAALRKSNERSQLVQHIGRVGYLDWDLLTNDLELSREALEIYHLDRSPTLDQIMGLVHPDDKERLEKSLNAAVSGTALHDLEHRVICPDGTELCVRVTAELFRNDDGTPARLLGTVHDVTERKRAEEEKARLEAQLRQAQKMEAVGRLAGGVAHDYNNMLGVILGYAELAMGKVAPSDPLHGDLEEIFKSAKRSTEITRQLLAFARKQTIAPKVLDLNETVEGMLKMLRRLIGEDIDLAWLPRAGLWPVRMDPSQLDQILANLCVNARDAIAGVGKVTIETGNVAFDEACCADHPEFVSGEFVLLAVSDDGCGMDEETLSSIFEPFFTTKSVGQGTGLGLSTVYGIVKQNSGSINVYSEPGGGTTFKIYLPRHHGDVETRTESTTVVPSGHGETVLIVEDEVAILKLTGAMLERLGYTVLTAATAGEALRLAEVHPGGIELLITDVVMPDMNGRELAERMQVACPTLKRLFMSGYTANVIAHRGVLHEDVHFIQKPFSLKDLAAKVQAAMDQA